MIAQVDLLLLSGSSSIKLADKEKELSGYECISLESLANLLDFWRDNQRNYPRLTKIARKYLCIPATQLGCERTFSRAGATVTKYRSRLHPDLVNAIVTTEQNAKTLAKMGKIWYDGEVAKEKVVIEDE